MNYSTLFKAFKNELIATIQYKRIGSPFKAFALVATLPFWIIWAVAICMQAVTLFIFHCVASSNDYLEAWVKDNRNGIQHATEAVLYFVTMPFIFFTRCILSFFSITFYLIWFMAMCSGYIASLGGIRWQPFISEAKFGDDIKIKATTNVIAGGVIVTIGFGLFCLYVLLYLIGLIAEERDIISFANIVDYIYTAYMVIAIPVTFKKVVGGDGSIVVNAEEEKPVAKADKKEEAEEELEF